MIAKPHRAPSPTTRPNSEARFLFIGHSHVDAFRAAFQGASSPLLVLPKGTAAHFLVLRVSDAVLLDSARTDHPQTLLDDWRSHPNLLLAEIENLLSDHDHIVVAWSGGNFLNRGVLHVEPAFDVILPDDAGGPTIPGSEIVPYTVFEDAARRYLEEGPVLRRLLALAKSEEKRLVLLGPPPPLPDIGMRKNLPNSRFVEHAAKLGIDPSRLPIIPESVRQKLWSILMNVYAEFAALNGVAFIRSPAKTLDQRGLLARAYWGSDLAHANESYAHECLTEVLAHFATEAGE